MRAIISLCEGRTNEHDGDDHANRRTATAQGGHRRHHRRFDTVGRKHLDRAGKLRGRVQAGRYWHSADVRAYVDQFRRGAAR